MRYLDSVYNSEIVEGSDLDRALRRVFDLRWAALFQYQQPVRTGSKTSPADGKGSLQRATTWSGAEGD